MTKIVLITGCSGMDGYNMVNYLLENTNNIIYGSIRRINTNNYNNLQNINNERFHIINMDITDHQAVINCFTKIMPDYIINFAAQSSVIESWNTPLNTYMINALPVMYFLETIRLYKPTCRFFSAGSSEEFGNVKYSPQDIKHPFNPISPYGISKYAAQNIVKLYRDSYNLFAIHAILYNHEGIYRGKEFVTRKITSNIARIKKEFENNNDIIPLVLGNINCQKDWSDSIDFIEAIWLMLNKDRPNEYILSSNMTHSIKEFIDLTCKYAKMDVEWKIDDINELNTVLLCNNIVIVKISNDYYRPVDVGIIQGDCKETMEILNWKTNITFEQLVKSMIENDIKLLY
jgi:GDPmannose 4,6-dehydratase